MTVDDWKGGCTEAECDKPAERSGSRGAERLCAAHRKRRQRQKLREERDEEKLERKPRLAPWAPLEARSATPLQALARSGRELADADAEMSNEKFKHVEERFRAALRRYVKKHRARSTNNPRSTP